MKPFYALMAMALAVVGGGLLALLIVSLKMLTEVP